MATQNLLVKQLVEFGLSEKEARVYLALLELEVAAVSEIAKKAGVNRSSTYVVLESLKKKGLVGTSGDKGVSRYVAASPETLLYTAERAAKKQQQIKEEMESVVPELKALHKDTRHRPRVRMYEGINGVRECYWDILSTKADTLRAYVNPANIFKYIPDFQQQDEERGKRGMKMYAINPASKEMLNLLKHRQPHPPFELVLIPEDKYSFTSDLGIYADRVTLVSPVEKFGIVIESKEIANVIKNIFALAYEEARRLAKKRSLLYRKMPGRQ